MKTIVAFLSRPHGYNVLCGLVGSPDYKILRVYTHMLNPKSQDPSRAIRNDYHLFEKMCLKNNIELISIDSKNLIIEDIPTCDFIIEVSWRHLIPKEIVSKSRIAAFGIHRGKLPNYAGAEPIKQALLNNEKEIVLTAHYLGIEIDKGGTITSISHPVNYDSNLSLEQNIQRLRDEITPLFSKLTFMTLNIVSDFGKKPIKQK